MASKLMEVEARDTGVGEGHEVVALSPSYDRH